MDFNNYDNDSEEELYPNQTKTGKIIKYTFRYILYGISLLVWVLIFYLVFSSKDPGMFKKMYFSENTRQEAKKDPGSFEIYAVQPFKYMNETGTIEYDNIYYSTKTKELEVGVQFNLKHITGGKVNDALAFVLTDSNGKCYKAVNIVTDSNSKYGYAKVTFAEVAFELDKNKYYNYHLTSYTASDFKVELAPESETVEEFVNNGVTYTISIYSYEELKNKKYAYVENGIINIDYEAFKLAQSDLSLTYDPVSSIDSRVIYHDNIPLIYKKYKNP